MSDFRLPLAALLLASGVAVAQAPDPTEWQNPQLTQQGQEAPRASFQLYEQPADVATDDYARSPWYQSLNGTWKFNYVARPAERPMDFFQPSFSDAIWKTIQASGFRFTPTSLTPSRATSPSSTLATTRWAPTGAASRCRPAGWGTR
jgi:hypothetical protein